MILWTPLLRIATKVTGWIQMKAAKEQWKQANLPAKVTIVAHSQPPNSSLPPSVNVSKQLGGQVGYPAHTQNAKPLVEILPKPDLVDGQDVKQLREQESKRRSDQCLKEAQKNRADGMPWLAEMNEALAMINRHQEDTNTKQLQERANRALDKHLEHIKREIG